MKPCGFGCKYAGILGDLSFGGTRDDMPGAVDPANPGNIVNSHLPDPFDGPNSSYGQSIDLDGDGDIDLDSSGNDDLKYFTANVVAVGLLARRCNSTA